MAAHRLEPIFKGKKKTADEPAQADAKAQETNQNQGQASAPEPIKPKPDPARGKRPHGAYENHPKFAKFKKGT